MEPAEFDPRHDADITGLELWEVLHALHANAVAIGMGREHDRRLPEAEARELVAVLEQPRHAAVEVDFDYVHGRPLKFGIVKIAKRAWVHRVDLYDRNSLVPARDVIEALRRRAPQR